MYIYNNCELPRSEGQRFGTVWKCEDCDKLWVIDAGDYPYSEVRYWRSAGLLIKIKLWWNGIS